MQQSRRQEPLSGLVPQQNARQITATFILIHIFSCLLPLVKTDDTFKREMLHLQTDLSIVDLGAVFMQREIDYANPVNFELDQTTPEFSLLTGIRNNISKAKVSDQLELQNCLKWVPVFAPGQQDYLWLSICNKTDLTVLSFHSADDGVKVERHQKFPANLSCEVVAPMTGTYFFAAICREKNSSTNATEPSNSISNKASDAWILLYNGFTLAIEITLQVPELTTFDLSNLLISTTSANRTTNFLFLGQKHKPELVVFALTFFETGEIGFSLFHHFTNPQFDAQTREFALFSVIPMEDKGFSLVMDDPTKLHQYYSFGFTWSRIYQEKSLTLLHEVSAYEIPTNVPLLQFDAIPAAYDESSAVWATSTGVRHSFVRYDYISRQVRTYCNFGDLSLASILAVQQFTAAGTLAMDSDVILLGKDFKNKTHLVFCEARSQSVNMLQLEFDVRQSYFQPRGMLESAYEALLISEDNTAHIVTMGKNLLVINSSLLRKPEDSPAVTNVADVVAKRKDKDETGTFKVSTLFDLNTWGWMHVPESIVLYADQDNQFSFPKTAFQVNAPQYHFKILDKSTKNVVSTFVNETTLKFPALSRSMNAVNHMGSNFLMIQNSTHFTIIGCTSIGSVMRCSKVFDHPNQEEVYAKLHFDGYFVVLTGLSNTESMKCYIKVSVYNLEGELFQNQTVSYKICPSQATLREHDDKLYVEILATDLADIGELDGGNQYLYSMNLMYLSRLNKTILQKTQLPSPICPTYIAWGFSRLNYLSIDSNCSDWGHEIITLDFRAAPPNNDEPAIPRVKHVLRPTTPHPLEICAAGFQLVAIDKPEGRIYLYMNGDANNQDTKSELEFPFKSLGMGTLHSYECIPDEGFISVLGEHAQTKDLFLINYQFGDKNKPWSRIHSVTNVSIKGARFVTAGEIVRQDEVVIFVMSNTEITAYTVQMSGPKIYVPQEVSRGNATMRALLRPAFASPEYYGEMDFTIMFVEQNKLGFGDYGQNKKLKSSEYPRRWKTLQLENNKQIDLEGFFGYKNPILEVSLAGIDCQIAKLRSRIELEDGDERGQQVDSLRVLKSSGRVFVLFNDSNLEIYEDNVKVYSEKNFFRIQHGTFLKNNSALVAVEHAPFVALDYLYKNGTVISIFCKVKIIGAPAKWVKYSFEIDINIDKVEGIAYIQELSPEPGKEQLEIRLAGTYNEGRILYQLQYFFSPIEKWTPKVLPDLRTILPGPAQYFEAKLVAFDVVDVNKIPVVFCLNLALDSIQFVSLTELNQFNANNAVSVDFPVSEKDFENAQLSCRRESPHNFTCALMVRYSPRSYLISIEITDPWFEAALPVVKVIKPIYNVQGFFPLQSSLMGDYLAVYNQNMDEMSYSVDYSGLHSVNTAGVHKPTEPQQTSLIVQPNPKLRTERSLIALYRLNSPSSVAWGILAQSTLQKLDPGEKLLSVFFALENRPREKSNIKDQSGDSAGSGTTTLLVNSQFGGRSKIRRFTIQNMRIEVKEARKLHKIRGVITLVGVDSTFQLKLVEIFGRNYWRILLAWLIYISFGVGIFCFFAWLLLYKLNMKYKLDNYLSAPDHKVSADSYYEKDPMTPLDPDLKRVALLQSPGSSSTSQMKCSILQEN